MRNYVFAGAVVLLLLLSAAYLGARSVYDTELSNAGAAFDPGRESSIPRGRLPADAPAAAYAALFFHSGARCATCRNIEVTVEKTIRQHFAEELASQQLDWRSYVLDQPENAKYIKAFGLFSTAVVLVRIQDGFYTTWKQLPKVWELSNNDAALENYIRDEIGAFINN